MGHSLQILTSKLRKALAQLPYLLRALGLVWQVARRWTIAWFALLAIHRVILGEAAWLVGLRVVIALGFACLAALEFRTIRRKH